MHQVVDVLGVGAADEAVGQPPRRLDRLGDEVEVTELALVARDGIAVDLLVEQPLDLVVEGVAVRVQTQDLRVGQGALGSRPSTMWGANGDGAMLARTKPDRGSASEGTSVRPTVRGGSISVAASWSSFSTRPSSG